jgi:hypothetical protein
MGFEAGDTNLYRFVSNRPTNATDPSGLQEKLGLQIIDFGKAPPPSSPAEKERDRLTSLTKLEDSLSDGKVGYAFTFDFVVAKNTQIGRRIGLQSLTQYLIVVGPDGTVTRPTSALKENNYLTFKFDQTDIVVPNKGSITFQDVRALLPFGALEGTVIAKDPNKAIPAVFAMHIVEGEAGLSKIGYTPTRQKNGSLESNQPTTSAGHKLILDSIDLQRTKTVTIYIFYNPKNLPGQDDPAKFVLDALMKADPEARKRAEEALKALKITLGNKPVEAYSFPQFGAPVIVNPK